MVVSVFGLWIMASNISFLNPSQVKDACVIVFQGKNTHVTIYAKTCKEVAEEINKKLDK